ncbi:hypothetical protein BBJ66_05335 [Rhizobium sp. RSm-3]|nr:hypothetical protein BBJ66_05335 [Rhizobium sp. RSm-3]
MGMGLRQQLGFPTAPDHEKLAEKNKELDKGFGVSSRYCSDEEYAMRRSPRAADDGQSFFRNGCKTADPLLLAYFVLMNRQVIRQRFEGM